MANRTVADFIDDARGDDVFIVGSGVSLAGFDFTRLNYVRSIALNGAIAAPGFEPAFHFILDGLCLYKWIATAPDTTLVCPWECVEHNKGTYLEVVTYHCVCPETTGAWPTRSPALDPRWPPPYGWLSFPEHRMTPDGDDLYCFNTCATGAIHFAAKMGARRIFLLGFDAYGHESDGSYFDGTRSAVDKERAVPMGGGRIRASAHVGWDMEQWRAKEFWWKRGRYREPWPGSGIFNLSEHSTLSCWQKVRMEAALEDSFARAEVAGV